MKKYLLLVLCTVVLSWSIPKPMESIDNYNVLMVHGAYGAKKGVKDAAFGWYVKPIFSNTILPNLDSLPDTLFNEYLIPSAYDSEGFLGDATLGSYTNDDRITYWLNRRVFEDDSSTNPKTSYIYNWRSFTNPANSSLNNAYELGVRTWNKGNGRIGEGGFGYRRALMEEAQEMKSIITQEVVTDFGIRIDTAEKGQAALEIIRQNPDLYRQLASRYILIGHSMGGVVSREYVQGNFYNGDVDKIITLDSPHEGTGAMNLIIKKSLRAETFADQALKNFKSSIPLAALMATPVFLSDGGAPAFKFGMKMLGIMFAEEELGNLLTRLIPPEIYYNNDPLVHYVDPLQTGYGTIDSLNHLDYKNKIDSLPMFRILASQHGMTFSDPDLLDYGILDFYRYLIPDNFTLPFANYVKQINGTGDFSARTVNALTSGFAGLAGMSMQENGSSIVPASSSEGRNVDVLNDSEVNVVRKYFNAAPGASGVVGDLSTIFEMASYAMVVIDYTVGKIWPEAKLAKIALGVGAGVAAASYIGTNVGAGIYDIVVSHGIPLDYERLNEMKVAKKSFTPIGSNSSDYDNPYLMEDFLYERPFVNLALSDSRTMDSLARNSSASLNPNCYFESDSLQKVPLCEVGLYGSRDSIVVNTHVIADSTGVGNDSVRYDTTHIYNSVAERLDSIGNVVRDSSGKVVYDSVYYGTFEQRKYSEFRKSPLKFKSESDWYKVGVKVDRWERVDGLKPNGDPAPKGVPIRHVERYNVPDIVVDGFIEKYSFVVDDLMPHRMRQIKMTFNSNEEIAWECNIKAAEDDPHACAVYKRLLGNSWGNPDTTIGDKGYVPHPIKKNGRFDFEARKYFGNLANIQKDNQNTVMISMVNKIGLSNTQRFYYLFKATANMLKPTWPQHDVVLNAIDGFKVYVSALDYQGFRVHGASDEFFRDSLDNYVVRFSSLDMGTATVIGNNGSEYVFASKRKDLNPAEGEYRWVVSANISNKELKSPSEPDSSKTDSYEVHFKVDRTAPAFTLTSDAMMNPDSSMFITRFKWDGSDLSDIRAMRWTLEKASIGSATSFTKYAELPALYDVASNEFAIAWDKVPQGKRDSMENGLYRIAAHAIDYAVPNLDAYHKVNALVDSIFSNPTNLSDSLWTRIGSLGLNDTTIYAEFRVDTVAPSFTFYETRAVTAADTVNYGTYVNLSGKYDTLRKNAPARDSSWTYISKDSLLQIGYTIMDTLNGLDSAAVTVGWNFVHIPDTNVIDRAGDSVWVFDSLGGKSSGTWTEMAGLRMADGEYSVHAVLRDAAKNVHHDSVPKRVRVDRTAPQIVGLTSDHLVYMDTAGGFSATILVSEKADIGVNRTGMHCSYRVLGGADSSWHEIRKGDRKLLANDTVKFSIAKASVDTARGIRYLEAACVDAAGNVSVRTDLFHVGARFPQITYPQADSIQSDQSFIPIVGIAPKTSSADSLSSVYRLRYRVGNDTTWRTDKVKVVAANRSTNVDYISRISQSTEGVLGYLENDNFGNEALVYVELAVASCETCDDWSAVTTNVVVIPPKANYNKPTVEFAVTRSGSDVNTFKVDDGPVDISVRLKNKFNSNYMLRVYAEDAKHRGIFDVSVEKVFYNPYYGTPTAAVDTAIWFYEQNGKYHLKWKNLDKINLKVGYNSAKFGETCVDSAGNTATGCSTEHAPVNFGAVLDAAKAYLADYPEWMPPAYIDSAMTIGNASGEIVMEAEDAFRVYVERKDPQDTSALNVPVYFGESDKAGFYWIAGVDTTISPLMTGWTVNPNAYGLDYRWNGIATSGAYPSGDITLYAEVTENILDNPFVNVVSKTLKVEQKVVELVAPKSLPDYIALKVVESNAVVVDDSNKVAYMRDSMKVYFGLKNGDARVKIRVLDSSKNPVRTLLDSTLSAHTGDSAYSVTWEGKDSLGNVQSVGTYYIEFASPSNAFKAETVPFEMKLRNGLPDETPEDPKTSNLGFYVAEAKKVADDVYRYEPYADYIVVANMNGLYLPDSLRNKTYNVTGNVSGTQDILGFRPERFSLGIKRHRDTLEMVIIRLVHSNTRKYDCGWLWDVNGGCGFSGDFYDDIKLDTVKFWENNRIFEGFDVIHYKDAGFYDPLDENYHIKDSTYFDVVACSMKKWGEFNKNRNNKKKPSRSDFDFLKSFCEWKLEDLIEQSSYRFKMPYSDADSGVKNVKMFSDDLSIGCSAVEKDGYLDSVCVVDNTKYDPNKRLFNVRLVTPQSGCFYTVWKPISSYGGGNHWQNINYEYHFEIPESYWNAPFGMDNLVNRTIRFDHTNKTIFNENEKDGYWNAVKKLPNSDRITGYFDGNKWSLNPKYGMLTPYEMQHLIFFYVDLLKSANPFNFDDESTDFMYPSSFELKFYGKDAPTHHFEAKVIGNLTNPLDTSGCVTDTSKFVMQIGADNPCQVSVTSIGQEVKKTPVFKHGNVHFFVGMNRLWSETDNGHRTTIPYPADSATWKNTIGDSCSATLGWESYKKIAEGKDSCYKYYGSGSKVHYYFKDYGNNDSLWKYFFLTDSAHYFRNYVNSPNKYVMPVLVDDFIIGHKKAVKGKDFVLNYNINPDDFYIDGKDSLSGKFFIRLDSLKKIKEEYAGAGIDIQRINVDSMALDANAIYDSSAMMLYVNAQRWTDTVVYRRSNDTTKTVLERPGDTISLRDIYVYRPNPDANSCSKALYCVTDYNYPQSLVRNPWIKNPVVESASIRQIDFSSHPVLEISGNRDSLDRIISFKDTIVARPPELVEIRGRLTPEQTYSLSYLNNSTYYSITDSLRMDPNCRKYMDGSCHLAWFNVNKLQGHTQFLLTWGGDINGSSAYPTNAMHFNMYVGSNVKPENNGVVKSMFGDLSVTFPEGSIDKAEDFTVRTVNVQKDYGFGVFKNMALTGPVMEVLPSMTFTDTNNLPRIQMRISKKEMEDMHVTPQTLRLYKVDFDRKEFVPLENALYGFLDAQGAPVMDLNGTDSLKCRSAGETNARCTDEKLAWEYVLISAETRTFSVFVAMDSLAASMPRMGLEVLPAVAKSSEREVRVDGVNDFNLYVDDDSLWNDDDLTPMEPLSFTLDMNGVAHVTLPNRLGEIDTNYVFAFAKVNDKEMFAPVVAKALTVPARFACRVPADSLWMGTDNGYLAYGAICNHPGNGILSLYMDNSLIAEIHGEIPDIIKYDGWRLVGGSMVGRVPNGRYETRYVGFSELGENLQLAGPVVRTDSARPVINAFEVFGGEDILDRVFTVRANVKDVESGIASVVVSSKLGNTSRVPLLLQPDSLGNVTGVIRLSRSELAKCNSCKLSLEMRAEDYGHNHVENTYESGKLYQYPTELALWYPSREGMGNFAREYVGTGHDLNLRSVTSPWLGDAGIYFSMPTDRAAGVGSNAGRVNLGTSNSYSFETRIKVGYSGAAGWHRVLGFKGDDGHEMELLVNGRRLQLRDGTRVWETSNNVLPVAKEWAHVVVTIDSLEVNFYVNGEIVKSSASIPQERKLDGVFSVGADNENSFIGNIADVRMYKKALTGAEVFVLSLPIPDEKDPEHEIIEIVTVPMVTVDGGDGFEPEFSCSVAGNRYFESDKDGAKLTMNARIEKAGTYKVMMYVRSALLKSANVAVLPSAGVRYAGSVALSPVWRTAAVSGISMNLSAGMHKITLEAPEGLQVAGFALVTMNVTASSIAWNAGLENPERKVKTFVRYEGFDDKKVLQPRVRLKNISGSQINGYSVRYYFRGEESSMAKVHAYYPYDTIGLALHSESARTGFAEWKFENGVIPAYGMVFNGNGPHFGVHYEDWTPWNPYDDPSFVENAARDFVEDDGIIVLDANKRLIGGSCVEMEDSVSAEVRAKVFAIETRNDNSASEFHVKVENVGNVTLKNYDVRYYFFLEGGLAPQLDSYVLPEGVSASLENIGEGRWQVSLHASRPLVSGGSWKDNAQIVLHCENWNDVWNASDDPSRVGLGREMVEAVGVNVFDSLGNRIYGNEPVWPEIVHVATADSSDVPDYGLKPKDDAIPIHRTDDGLIIELLQYADISLSLVNAVGVPVKNLYSGTIASGKQFIRVDWTGIDLNRTYLMLRVNGRIKSTKLLSLL
ncbi:MAG: hypothetical protein IJM92_15505 [Fibrobacter sp.]|uniref:LamG-like jellyroll fold domain-containing protein n=1 Tax=Fibrobacter sp. TaxID=35828 RepID=UPI0025C096EA|nr:LamG-like jellyroll fold domain-containing protein [Fibrobacter sp.]MBQ7081028.1 hypothetical protein [Fibrobacter sp.]